MKAKKAQKTAEKKAWLQLRGQLTTFVGVMLVTIITVLSVMSIAELNRSYSQAISIQKQSYDTKIETAVENMVSVLNANYKRYQDGEISEDQAYVNAQGIVRDSRYDNGGGYFWADMADGKCAVHMNSDYEGKMRLNDQDLNGTYYIKNLITAGNSGGGFTEFYFTKPGETGSFKKRAYTMKFEPYGWYISTGNYYDDIDRTISAQNTRKTTAVIGLLASSIALSVVSLLLMNRWAHRIADPIQKVTRRLLLLAEGDIHTPPVPKIKTRNETGMLTEATDELIVQMRSMTGDIADHLQKMAAGDLTSPIERTYIGDFLPIKESMETIYLSLNRTLKAVDASADQVNSGSTMLATAAQSLSSGSSEQSSAVEELSASIMEVTDTAEKNAEHAKKAANHTEKTANSIEDSHRQMMDMLKAMEQINAASAKIRDVTKMVEELAFQTNILALNAAIEASHAGEAGKGFAVVADEVRELAGKSAEAAKQTQELIGTSMAAVESGSRITQDMAKSIETSFKGMEDIKTVIRNIEQSSASQARSIEQITQGLEQISSVVQTNAATAEETSASSEELSMQANALYQELEKFRLSEDKMQDKE